MNRVYSFIIAILSLLCFLTLFSFALIKPAPQLFIFSLLILPLVLLSLLRKPFWQSGKGQNFFLILFCGFLCFVKHGIFPCEAKIEPFFDFSLVFSFGQGFAFLCFLELIKKNGNKSLFIFYSCMMLVIASYSVAPFWLIGYMTVYTLGLIFFSRTLPCFVGEKKPLYPFRRFMIISICFIGSCSISIFLAKFREPLGSWNPIDWLSSSEQKATTGFSPYSVLGSKEWIPSNKVVLRYFASPGIYYLRGYAFDTYSNRRWILSQEKLEAIPAKKDRDGNSLFKIQASAKDTISEHHLVFLDNFNRFVFLPLECNTLITREFSILSKDQENIVFANPPFPQKWNLLVSKSIEKQDIDKERYLQIPLSIRDYLEKLSEKIVAKDRLAEKKARAIALYLRKNYPYRTKIIVSPEEDAIVDFLEKREGGHCEMFASAFVMLARAQKIPSRYVAGYYAHEWNSWGEFLTVREADAHAWAEIWLPEKGWQTIEPTSPTLLQESLNQRRGLFSSFLEVFSEWIRLVKIEWSYLSLCQQITIPSIFAFAFIVFLILLAKIKNRRKNPPQKIKKYLHQNSDIDSLLQEICVCLQKKIFFPKKRENQTFRDYLKPIEPSFPIYLYLQELLTHWEKEIYGGIPTDRTTLEHLKTMASVQNQIAN